MKKIFVSLGLIASLASTPVLAGGGHHHHGGHYGGNNVWIPLIVGGAVGYGISQANRPQVIVQQAPVVVQQAPVYTQQPQQYCESTQVIDQFGQARQVTFCYYK